MHLKDRSRNLRSYRSEKCLRHDIRLVFSAHDYQNLLRPHNRTDSHSIRLPRNVGGGSKKSLIRLDGTLLQVYAVGLLVKGLRRLIKTDMPVMSQS